VRGWDDMASQLGAASWLSQGGLEERETRTNLLSKLMTFPCTLACNSQGLGLETEAGVSRPVRVAVLGARAESTLPHLFWQQLGLLTGLRWHLEFMGPHAGLPRQPYEELSAQRENVKVDFSCRMGLFHETHPQAELSWDAFVFFNSGIGHPKEGERWDATIKMLLGCGKPVLFTSFNGKDLDRDLAALKSAGIRTSVIERANPMRSISPERVEGDPVFFNHCSVLARF